MKKLIAIDGNSLMHRAFYALPSMTTKSGTPTGAIYGFMSMLFKLLTPAPDYLLVAFDMHGPTFRHLEYADYKAGRKATPDDLRTQFPLVKELLCAMGIRICECESYEADDILGTFSRLANESGVQALLVTGDRDTLQLISAQTHVLLTKKGITETIEYDEAQLMESYGLTPSRMPDLKGLMGDSSDNIPGIPGVGEKTALKLLEKYGTLEETLAHAENEKGALGEKLLKNADLARMSYRIGLINREAPLDIGLSDCAFHEEAMANAYSFIEKLEMRSLLARLPAPTGGNRKKSEPTEEQKARSISVNDNETLAKMIEEIAKCTALAIDLADGTLTLSTSSKTVFAPKLEASLLESGLDAAQVLTALKDKLEDETCTKLVFDAKRTKHILDRYGITLKGVSFDAMIADYLLHAIHPAESFQALCRELFSSDADASKLFALEESMRAELEEKGLLSLYETIEMPLSQTLYSMEKDGFAVDAQRLFELQSEFSNKIKASEEEIYRLAGGAFNILSPKQLGSVLFDEDKLALPVQKKTKSGYSTDAEVMEKIQDMHPIVPLIMEYRQISKLKSTFVDALLIKSEKEGGKVHTSFNQNVTATGRISSTEPNLQNIPVRTQIGREIRKAFIASPGNVLLDADYSQIELRLLAHMSGDPTMIESFNEDVDIHAKTASEVFSVPLDAVTKAQRSAAKAVNFGIVYGISDFGLARNLGISRKTAAEYIRMYLERYPLVKDYMHNSVEAARKNGYVTTLFGRRRDIPEIRSGNYNTRAFGERVAMNMPIQGTAADIIKLAMVRVYETLQKEKLGTKLILQVHDELILDAPVEEADRASVILKECMQNAIKLDVPLIAEVEQGDCWYDAK